MAVTIADAATDAIAADLDMDGDLDIISASTGEFNTYTGSVLWLENRSEGWFAPHIIYQGDQQPNSVFTADIDNDGDIDILASFGDFDEDRVVWYENAAGLIFVEHIITTVAEGATDVFAIDVITMAMLMC